MATTFNSVSHAETLGTAALDELEATGALQRPNWMGITELLNPAIEANDISGTTDQDIYECVMEVKRMREHEGLNSDDVDIPEPVPTHCEALQAALALKRYLHTFGDDMSFACKLEGLLGLFGQQTWAAEM